jgi:prepilin-type N-terminal cleavage/methylation domain-containing protein
MTPANDSRHTDRRGFTLLELLLAISVMGVILGLGLPRLEAVRDSYLSTEQARQVAGFLRAARLDAVACRTTVAVTMEVGADDVLELRRLEDGRWPAQDEHQAGLDAAGDPNIWIAPVVRRIRVDGALRLQADGTAILFHANGRSGGGVVSLAGPGDGRGYDYLVEPSTGEIHMQRTVTP